MEAPLVENADELLRLRQENFQLKEACASYLQKLSKLGVRDDEASDETQQEASDRKKTSQDEEKDCENFTKCSLCLPDNGKDSSVGTEAILKQKEIHRKMMRQIAVKTKQAKLAEQRCEELNKRLRNFSDLIDDQEVVIQGMTRELDTYFEDNQKMSRQLGIIVQLFIELERNSTTQNNPTTSQTEVEDEDGGKVEANLDKDEVDSQTISVSKTIIKLKNLILEKKSLVTEIERLKVLNDELERRVNQQQNRLVNVTDELHSTWMVVSKLRDQHEAIHTNESVMRYELKEKRQILQKLKAELEWSREQWHRIRQKNSESEQEWNNIREELNQRRKTESPTSVAADIEAAELRTVATPTEFEPPVDLLLDMGIEYGVIDADGDTSTTAVMVLEGEDVHASRLQELEDQCAGLYQKLVSSTGRSLTLASRLTAIHNQYSEDYNDESDEDSDDDQMDDDDDLDEADAYELPQNYESEVVSPDSEGYDTAYVSEPDGLDTASPPETTVEDAEDPSEEDTDQTQSDSDILSRRLINMLPKKVDLLRRENKKLEEKILLLETEKKQSESALRESLDGEIKRRKDLETQLQHVGKIVEELRLERTGQVLKATQQYEEKMTLLAEKEEELKSLEEKIRGLQWQIQVQQSQDTQPDSAVSVCCLQGSFHSMNDPRLQTMLTMLRHSSRRCTTCKTIKDILNADAQSAASSRSNSFDFGPNVMPTTSSFTPQNTSVAISAAQATITTGEALGLTESRQENNVSSESLEKNNVAIPSSTSTEINRDKPQVSTGTDIVTPESLNNATNAESFEHNTTNPESNDSSACVTNSTVSQTNCTESTKPVEENGSGAVNSYRDNGGDSQIVATEEDNINQESDTNITEATGSSHDRAEAISTDTHSTNIEVVESGESKSEELSKILSQTKNSLETQKEEKKESTASEYSTTGDKGSQVAEVQATLTPVETSEVVIESTSKEAATLPCSTDVKDVSHSEDSQTVARNETKPDEDDKVVLQPEESQTVSAVKEELALRDCEMVSQSTGSLNETTDNSRNPSESQPVVSETDTTGPEEELEKEAAVAQRSSTPSQEIVMQQSEEVSSNMNESGDKFG